MRAFVIFFLVIIKLASADEFHKPKPKIAPSAPVVNVMEGSRTFWVNNAQRYITSQLNQKLNTNKAKNIIFFIGDGMGQSTVAAARMYLGKEERSLSFEKFPHFGFAKTYCVDAQTADSACTATAFLSGVKNNDGLLGVNANVVWRQCEIPDEDHAESILGWAQKAGKATGIVTTTRITHATPAGAYAHSSSRSWENNDSITPICRETEGLHDIAYQLVHNEIPKNFKVILGGGRRGFVNTTALDDEGRPGLRTDGRNLIDEWVSDRSKSGKAKYVWHKQQLDEIDVENTDYLLGLFEDSHCMYQLDIDNNNLGHQEPSLTDMTVKALKMLQKEENGYFLFVESGRIDHAHHSNTPQRGLEDTLEFSRVIDVVRKMTSEDDTLIVVSADHSHVFTYNGNPNRGNHVLEFGGISDEDQKPYETLSYANGPGQAATYVAGSRERVDLRTLDLKNPSRRSSATAPLSSETHGAEDVGVYASGPWSHLFVGNYEQNVIPVAMAYAAKIGQFAVSDEKNDGSTVPTTTTTDSAGMVKISLSLMLMSFVVIFQNYLRM